VKVCSTPGCPVLVERGKCDAHATRRSGGGTGGYPPDWKRKSAAFLKDHPWCECDECSLIYPKALRPIATVTDHIVAVKDGGTHDPSNFRAMAHGHHSKRTARDQPGGWNSFQQRDRLRAGRTVERSNPGRDQRRSG